MPKLKFITLLSLLFCGLTQVAGCSMSPHQAQQKTQQKTQQQTQQQPQNLALLQQQVLSAETAFAASMAQRDHVAFSQFLSEEAVFFSDDKVLRGKSQVAEGWRPYFLKSQAPFSWAADQIEVLDSGTLAHSSGPVYNAQGKLIARFSSIWRLEAPGSWRIIFDKGNEVCECSAK
ncbi:nuclear transport factor 2 family protein [Undibacterium sp.]|uniref:YybH family protein n=1 Tax=Undibacterium sp. TaxID=1914977 RepID=UPI0025E9A7C5|nr:nuclear transport factor 2 family protein [Undibacterium sp.]